jgi:GR25 family glycosyltransferase involved in LPS biosynthesis
MNKKTPPVGIFVLGKQGSLRNPQLENLGDSMVYVDPVYVEKAPTFRARLMQFVLNGKVLNRGELGCAQAHINIRAEVLKSQYDWNLVLEDDVGLPEDWFDRLRSILAAFPDSHPPSVILLNTLATLNFGDDPKKLSIKPSLTNAFLIHRSLAGSRPFTYLEEFEVADWPVSFSGVDFWMVSDVATDLAYQSTIGGRKPRRILFLSTVLIRFVFSPLIALLTKLPIATYIRWALFAPLRRDVVVRISRFRSKW